MVGNLLIAVSLALLHHFCLVVFLSLTLRHVVNDIFFSFSTTAFKERDNNVLRASGW